MSFLVSSLSAQALPVTRCINLSNALEAPVEGDWGHEITQSNLRAIAKAGFDTVRLPVQFSAHFDATRQRLEPDILARVDQVITWAFEAELTVILDLHHFDALMKSDRDTELRFVQIWTHLGAHYKNWPDKLIFELLNEPHGALTTQHAEALFDRVYPLLRKDHPSRWIITEGGDWADRQHLSALAPRDAATAHSFHYYEPFSFTHQLADWADPIPPKRGPATLKELAAIADDFGPLQTHPTPLFLGEFGVNDPARVENRAAWLQQVRQSAEAAGISWCVWGLAGSFAIFDHAAGEWHAELLDALIPQD